MATKSKNISMRIIHRYLGFFLVVIMSVYAISGIVLIFRDTDFLRQETLISKEIKKEAQPKELSKLLKIKRIKITKSEAGKIYFQNGFYDQKTGIAEYTTKELPFVLKKMTTLHKSKSSEPLYFLNIFFGISLLFFALSSFWMYTRKSSILKKGLYFTLGGILITLILLFI